MLNEHGQVLAWQLTKGTSFEKVRSLLENLCERGKSDLTSTNFYIDNCCAWKNKLKKVFGDNVEVKLDLFHAVQRVTKTIPKHGKQDSVIKMIRRRMTNEFTMIFRDPSDHGPSRTMNTPSISKILQQLDNFLLKWEHEKFNEENIHSN